MTARPVCMLFYLLLGGGVVSGLKSPFPAKILSECVQYDHLQDQKLTEALGKIKLQLGPPGCNPPKNRSCQEILSSSPSARSGYYQIRVPNGSLVQVYCDMEGTNCGGEGGWMRVADVDMSQSGATCPQGLTQTTLLGLTLCVRNGTGCQSTVFSTLGLNYSQVCGQVRGYQHGTPDAFRNYYYYSSTIDGLYVDGVSITYDSAPRKHIWTYVCGMNLLHSSIPQLNCPCNTGNAVAPPPFVGSDYYCETGNNDYTCCDFTAFYPNDPLWDGQQCTGKEAPCCTHPNMPWFHKTLSETTTEDIELRLCGDNDNQDEEIPLQVIELLVR